MNYKDISNDELKQIIKDATNWEDICNIFNITNIIEFLRRKINRLNIDCSHITETYIEYNKKIKNEDLGHISKEKFNEIVKNAKCWDDVIRGCNLKLMSRSLQRRLNKIDHSHLPKNFSGLYSKLGKYSKEYYEELVNNSKSWDDILENLKYTSTLFINTIKKHFDIYKINYSHLTYPEKISNGKKIELKDILVENSMYSNGNALKQKLKIELGWKHECLHCSKSTFSNLFVKDIPIPLEIDHINGIHNDNRIENLRFLCPNCHSLTPTYCSKNMAKTKQNKENPKQKEIKPKKEHYKKPTHRKCIDCNKDMLRGISRCIECNNKYTFTKYLEKYPNIPSYEQLKKDLDELQYYTAISNKYNVSDRTIKKWFVKYEIYNKEYTDDNVAIKQIKEDKDLTNEIIEPNIITEIEKINNKCLDCDKDISNHSTRCIDCNYKNKFIEASTDRPSYEQLKKDFEELKYYTTIAKKYSVSDNTIRKWMKKYEKYSNEI